MTKTLSKTSRGKISTANFKFLFFHGTFSSLRPPRGLWTQKRRGGLPAKFSHYQLGRAECLSVKSVDSQT